MKDTIMARTPALKGTTADCRCSWERYTGSCCNSLGHLGRGTSQVVSLIAVGYSVGSVKNHIGILDRLKCDGYRACLSLRLLIFRSFS